MGHENWRRSDDTWGVRGRGGNVQGHRSLNVGADLEGCSALLSGALWGGSAARLEPQLMRNEEWLSGSDREGGPYIWVGGLLLGSLSPVARGAAVVTASLPTPGLPEAPASGRSHFFGSGVKEE